ncbi:MAG: AAA family ATPase [Flavobacterium sp.]|nr:AAA family ATPase [Flavobacterium sp.]
MLDSLEIKNFRNLKHLRIESLGAVNLIIGKNNTGKSAILEAMMIYASKGDLNMIYYILDGRGENYILNQASSKEDLTALNVKSLSSLFTDRQVVYSSEGALFIGKIENALSIEQRLNDDFVALNFVKYIYEDEYDSFGDWHRKKVAIKNDLIASFPDNSIGLEISTGKSSYIHQLKRLNNYKLTQWPTVQFVSTSHASREANGRLWDTIALTDKEQYVIDALKIIEKDIDRIAFIEDGPGNRVAKIKLKNSQDVVPLQSMGDGINRILTIILALVNADGGYLLIDEFENGLHHSVQKQLWEIVFFLSKKLNVQVFATTHSEDCIKGFETVLNSDTNDQSGKLIRLALKNGVVSQEPFDAKELELATENDIEIR